MSAAASQVRVRAARAGDAAGILALERSFPGDRMSVRSVRHFLRVPTASVRVAVAGGNIAGAVILLLRRNSR